MGLIGSTCLISPINPIDSIILISPISPISPMKYNYLNINQ